jgi:hypothetical protein
MQKRKVNFSECKDVLGAGSLVPASIIPAIVGISRQSVWRLIESESLISVKYKGMVFVSLDQLQKRWGYENKN